MSAHAATLCSAIAPSEIRWLWKPYLARGKLAILDGDPGTGKSFVTIDLAAHLSRGQTMPGGQKLSGHGYTLLLSAEDHAADTLRPRLVAAGAELDRVVIGAAPGLGAGELPQFPAATDDLRNLIYDRTPDLVVIDPMMAFFPPQVNANNDQCIRTALTPLALLAAETDCAILLVRHLSKTGGGKSIYRGAGSIGIMGAVRTGLMLARHMDDPDLRVLAMTKTNIGPVGPSLGFRLAPHGDGSHAVVKWTGPVDLTSDELCARTTGVELRPRERAAEWLRAQLATGPRKAADLEQEAEKAGIAWRTLERAKDAIEVVSEKKVEDGRGVWYWIDPSVEVANSVDPSGMSPVDKLLSTSLPPLPPLPDFDDDEDFAMRVLNRFRAKLNKREEGSG